MLYRLLTTGFLSLLFACTWVHAQEAPLYSQYFTNPYLYNPSFAGTDGYPVVFLTLRRQWAGIEGAPTAYALSFHTPVSKVLALGAHIRTESRGVLQSSLALGSLAYVAHFSDGHFLRMGLSAGVSHHSADFSEATEAQQPYLANWASKALRFEAGFGINYHLKHFNLGLALPHLTQQTVLGSEVQDLFTFSPFDQWVATASYYAELTPEKLALEPLLVVQKVGEEKTRLEAGAVLYMNKALWAGATYRHQYGITALAGVNIKPGISFGYAYELANAYTGSWLQSTHELQLKFKLGAEKEWGKEVQHKPRFEM
ncbi:Bacteroidetes-specific putative membrane protein [Flammeovirgaceae bacterium 311]|nr:Bacteroidetes-specific putative membrane protein [Flammeovirgaceae bacterium 311]